MHSDARSRLKRATCSVVVTRADGSVENHGVVARYERNPLKRLWLRATGRKAT